MKIRRGMRSRNVHDRRGLKPGGAVAGGGGVVALGLVVASIFFPEVVPILDMLGIGPPNESRQSRSAEPINDDVNEFVSVTLGYTEDFWDEAFAAGAFPRAGNRYKPAKLVLFSNAVRTGCGPATVQSGPFYCPADQSIYIDPAFYRVMERQLNSPGDFAQAYVIAHETAHHVQFLSGLLRDVHIAKSRAGNETEGNRLTVRLELQADCFAGVWARRTDEKHAVLEPGDLGEALNAAHQVGDDILMRMGGGRVDESKFTHGTSEQRTRWFRAGYESADLGRCDTFSQSYDRL